MFKWHAYVRSIHARIQYVGVVDMTPTTTREQQIIEQKLFEVLVCKPRLLFENSLCAGLQFQKCGFCPRAGSMFYLRAAFI